MTEHEPDRDPDWESALGRFQTAVSSPSTSDSLHLLEPVIQFSHLSKHAPDHVLAIAIPLLASLLLAKDSAFTVSPLQEAAAYCLKLVACRKEGALATEVGKSGALGHVLRLLSSLQRNMGFGPRMVLVGLLRCVVNFSEESRVLVVQEGGVEVVAGMLGWVEDGARVCLLEVLSALALVREARRVLVRVGGLRFLVEAGRVGGMVSRERACQAMGLVGVSRVARPMLVELGAVPVIVELLRDGDGAAKIVVGNALGVVSSHVDFVRLVGQAGAIPLYVELLCGGGSIGKEIAEDVFSLLAVDEENAVAIAEHLVRILRVGGGDDDDDAKVAAADVLWDMLAYKHSVSVVRNTGAVPVLVELLRDGNLEIKEKVAGAIARLSNDDADRAALVDAGAVPILIELLDREELDQEELDELRDNAAEAIVNFAKDPQQLEIISESLGAASLQRMQTRVVQLRGYDEHTVRSLRRMSIQQLTRDPSLA